MKGALQFRPLKQCNLPQNFYCQKAAESPPNAKGPPLGDPVTMAGSEGFEPSMSDKTHTPLAGERLQPLGQLPGADVMARKPPGYKAFVQPATLPLSGLVKP